MNFIIKYLVGKKIDYLFFLIERELFDMYNIYIIYLISKYINVKMNVIALERK